MSKSIKKNFLYSSFLTTANYIFPLLTYPYVSRVLGVENIGICNFVDSIIQYFIMFSMLGTVTVGIRAIAQNRDNQQALDKAFNSVFLINTISTVIVLIAFILFYLLTPKVHIYFYLMVFGAFKIVFNYLQIEWFYKGIEDFKYITLRTLLVKLAYVFSIFLFIRDCSDYPLYYLLSVLMIVVNALINVKHAKEYVHFSTRNIEIRKYLRPFFILGIDLFCGAIYTTLNVAYLGFVTNAEQVGYYTTATKLYYICLSLYTAFTGVMIPRMSSLCANGEMDKFKDMLSKSYRVLFMFSVPAVIYVILNANNIIRLIAGKGYEGAVNPLIIIMPLMCILGYKQVIILQGFLPLNKNNAILANSAIGAAVSVMLSLLLVPRFQAVGTAWVWLFAEFSGLLLSQFLINKYIGFKFPIAPFCKNIIFYIPMGALLYIISRLIENVWISLFATSSFFILYWGFLNIVILKEQFVLKLIRSIINKIHK